MNDRSNLWLDDCHEYETVKLGNDITVDVILPRIGPSRVLSYSMFIDPIHRLRNELAYDQLLELCLFASFQCSPYWFNYCLMNLADRHFDDMDPFRFGVHPFYDIADEMDKTFGGWQCAIHKRFQPCGGNLQTTPPAVFGFGEYVQNREQGISRLKAIIKILLDFTDWIDSLVGHGQDPTVDMPMELLAKTQDNFIQRIHGVTPCQFNLFRLGIFTTILTGSGLLKEGVHLNHLGFPVDGLASLQHLRKYSDKIFPKDYDDAMLMIAYGLGIPYLRSCIETLLVRRRNMCGCMASLHLPFLTFPSSFYQCESLPGRIRLYYECVDWFCRGGTIFDVTPKGRPLFREYGGASNDWTEYEPVSSKKLSYLNGKEITDQNEAGVRLEVLYQEEVTLVHTDVIQDLVEESQFGPEKTYNKDPPGGNRFAPVSVRDSYHYHGNWESEHQFADLLDDGYEIVSRNNMCVLGEGFDFLFDYLKSQGYHHKMMVVRRSKPSRNIEIFPIHKDKVCFGSQGVAFVPISSSFYTILQLPRQSCDGTGDSSRKFLEWVVGLRRPEDKKGVASLLQTFGVNKDKFLGWLLEIQNGEKEIDSFEKEFDSWPLVFECKPKSVLAFNAVGVAHATIVPRSTVERQLLILTELSYTEARGKQLNRRSET